MNDEHSFAEAYASAGDMNPIKDPQDGAQGWARLNQSSWVVVEFVAKSGGWYTHRDAKEIRAAMRAEERRVRKDSLPAG